MWTVDCRYLQSCQNSIEASCGYIWLGSLESQSGLHKEPQAVCSYSSDLNSRGYCG